MTHSAVHLWMALGSETYLWISGGGGKAPHSVEEREPVVVFGQRNAFATSCGSQ